MENTTTLAFKSILEVFIAASYARKANIDSTAKISRTGYSVIFHASPEILERELFVASV